MAITSIVQIDKTSPDMGGFASSGAQQDELSMSGAVVFTVDYSDPADTDFDGSGLDAPYVLANVDLPLVNGSAWYNPTTDKLYPFLICRSKEARRHPKKKTRWFVTTRWSTGRNNNATTESDLAGVDPPADGSGVTDLTPQYEWSLGEQEKRIYEDLDGEPLLTPAGNQFPQPFYERIATIKLVVRHYQVAINYEQLRERRFKMNSDTWNGNPINSWFINNCSATEVAVQLANGSTFKAALVVHELEYTVLEEGWKNRRALIDTHYIDPNDNNKAKAFQDGEYQTQWVGNVDSAGYPKDEPIPDTKDFNLQGSVEFIPLMPPPSGSNTPTASGNGSAFRTWGTSDEA